MTTVANEKLLLNIEAFNPSDLDGLIAFYRRYGFVVLRGVFPAGLLERRETECVQGTLPERYGSTVFLDEAAKVEQLAHYVEYVNVVAPAVADAVTHPLLV